MNNSDLAPGILPDSIHMSQSQDSLLSPTEGSSSCLSGFGYSVQILDSNDSGYLGRQEINHSALGSPLMLNDSSIFHFPSAENLYVFPEFNSENDLFETVTEYVVNESESVDGFTITDSNSTDSQQRAQPSLHSDDIVWSLNQDTEHQPLTEAVKLRGIESFGSGKPVPVAPEEVHVSEAGKAGEAKYVTSDKDKTGQAKYTSSNKGEASGAKIEDKHDTSDILLFLSLNKVRIQAKYAALEKTRTVKRKYGLSNKRKTIRVKKQVKYIASDKSRTDRTEHVASDRSRTDQAERAASDISSAEQAEHTATDKNKADQAEYDASIKSRTDQAE